MKLMIFVLCVALASIACGSSASTPVMKVDDLWAERDKSKAEFQKKYGGKEIAVAGTLTYVGSKPAFDFKSNSQGFEEISVYGTSFHLVHCQIEEKDAAGFKDLPGKGEGIAVKGKLISSEDDAYPELRPCSIVSKQ